MERFCGVLIEHFGGNFPTWLAPERPILPMNDDLLPYATCLQQLKAKKSGQASTHSQLNWGKNPQG